MSPVAWMPSDGPTSALAVMSTDPSSWTSPVRSPVIGTRLNFRSGSDGNRMVLIVRSQSSLPWYTGTEPNLIVTAPLAESLRPSGSSVIDPGPSSAMSRPFARTRPDATSLVPSRLKHPASTVNGPTLDTWSAHVGCGAPSPLSSPAAVPVPVPVDEPPPPGPPPGPEPGVLLEPAPVAVVGVTATLSRTGPHGPDGARLAKRTTVVAAVAVTA